MSLFGHQPPRVPAGGLAFVSADRDAMGRLTWSVRVAMPGEDQTSVCRKLSPTFELMDSADRWLAWVSGGPRFVYGPGEA